MRAVSFARCLGTNAVANVVFFFSGFIFLFIFIFIFPLPDAFLGVLRNLAVPGNCALRKFWEVKPGCSFLFPYA